MTPFTDLQQATTGIVAFMMTHGSGLPEATRDAVLTAAGQPSPVDQLMGTLEALYAAKADIPDEGKELVAKIAEIVTPLGWHGIQEDNRGSRIQMAMLRDLGEDAPEGMSWPDPEDDPAPSPRYAPAEPGDPAPPA